MIWYSRTIRLVYQTPCIPSLSSSLPPYFPKLMNSTKSRYVPMQVKITIKILRHNQAIVTSTKEPIIFPSPRSSVQILLWSDLHQVGVSVYLPVGLFCVPNSVFGSRWLSLSRHHPRRGGFPYFEAALIYPVQYVTFLEQTTKEGLFWFW